MEYDFSQFIRDSDGKDSVQVEEAIESNPEIAASILPQGSAIQKEARQVTDDNPHNSEVRNDVVDDFVNNDRYKRIKSEFDDYMKKYNGDQYAGNSFKKRQSMGQFYTPPELTYQMLSKFRKDDMSDEDFENMLKTESLMDPTAGSGNLLAGGISYGFNPENVYANEPDDNVRDNILVPRLTSLGVPRNHIFPSSKHIAKYGKMSDTPEQKEAKYKEWVDNGWISDSKSNKKTFMDTYGAGNALNGNYLEDMLNPETWDEIIENVIESSPEQAQEIASSDLPEPIKEEAEQRLDDNPNNDEVNNEKIKEGIKALSNEEEYKLNNPEPDLYPHGKVLFGGDRKGLLNGAIDQQEKWGGNFEQRDVPTIYDLKGSPEFGEDPNLVKNNFAAAMQNWRSWNDTNESDYLANAGEDERKLWRKHEKWRKGLEKAIAKDKAKPVADKVEEVIEERPEAVKSDPLMPKEAKKEATQVTDGDARTDEANNEAVEKTIEKLSEDFDTVDDLYNYLENYGMGWNDGRVEDVDLNGPDFPVDNNVYARDEDFLGPDEVVDYGLDDQNQYPAGIGNLDETVAQENVPEVNENDFVKSDVLPSADNVLELKPEEQEVVTEAVEEAAPEEDKETYFGMLGLPHRQFDGSSHSSVNANNEQYKLDRLSHAGASSLGRLGGFSTGSGSVRPGTVSTGVSKPHVISEHVSSRAGGGNIPKSPNAAANAKIGSRAGSSNNGFVTSNGGSVSSGPVQKRSSLKPPKPVQLPNFTGHTAPIQTNQLGSSEDLHDALIERIKGMLDNLDVETRKKLGFSPTLYNYNGTPLNKLDGATLVQLSEMLEGMQNN